MKDLRETRIAKALGGKGLIITLGACALAVGGASIAAYNRTANKITQSLELAVDNSSENAQKAQADSINAEADSSEALSDDTSSTADSTEQEDSSSMLLNSQPNVMPVNGEIIKKFSNGSLVRSETLGIWKTHDGVDIKADPGTPVKAMNHGTVTKVWEDPLWGYSVIIDHGDGIESHYYNLTSAVTVIEGDEVDSGDVIGAVGDTAQIEATEPSHLHFALKRNGNWIDPIGFIDPAAEK